MPLTHGQVQIGDLVLGPETAYRVLSGTNPWTLSVRADQSGPRPWNHGGWSGAEWADERIIPLEVAIDTNAPGDWLSLHQQLSAAFAPVGDAATDEEFRFGWGGAEYLLLGRPRMVDPQAQTAGTGRVITRCGFVATDPLIYSGEEQVQVLGLPQFEGGLSFPLTFPFTFDGVLVNGSAAIENEGTAPTSLLVRIDGPVLSPRFSVQYPGGGVDTLRFLFDLQEEQWLDIDTASHTVLLNGVASRRGQTVGDFPKLPAGTSTLRFNAAEFNNEAQLTARWRYAWW